MNKFVLFLLLVSLFNLMFFTACKKDTTAPKIYFLDKDGEVAKSGDTTILLYTKFVDPGCYVEDNASVDANIVVTSDIDDVLTIEKKAEDHIGQVKRTGDYIITYTATDEENNVGTSSKTVKCVNVSNIYSGKYITSRSGSSFGDTIYSSTISASTSIAGRIRFPKVCCHTYNGQKVYFKVDADLYSFEHSIQRSQQIGYMGTSSDKETPFYKGMSYEQAADSVRHFRYLQIPAQTYVGYSQSSDSTESEVAYEVYIQGKLEADGKTPRSRIEYIEGTDAIKRIVLELNITRNSVVDQRFVEIYSPE